MSPPQTIDDYGGRADFVDAELADDAGDVAATVIARDLARDAAIPAGGEEAEEEEEARLVPPAGCPDASHRSAPASSPLGAPMPLVC